MSEHLLNHKLDGKGIVTDFFRDRIIVRFGLFSKVLPRNKLTGMIETSDPYLLDWIDNKITSLPFYGVSDETPKPQKPRRKQYMPTTSSRLVGPRAESIPMSCEQWFEVVGYMACPGRVSSFEAEIPKDGRDETFEKLFPGQVYRPIELGDTPSGLPNKLGPQFRINFSSLHNCPPVLKANIRAGNGGCVGRINKSRFVVDLVQFYGFRFGKYQDVAAIRKIAEDNGYLEEFEKGYSL